jgi:hypothetical protein
MLTKKVKKKNDLVDNLGHLDRSCVSILDNKKIYFLAVIMAVISGTLFFEMI